MVKPLIEEEQYGVPLCPSIIGSVFHTSRSFRDLRSFAHPVYMFFVDSENLLISFWGTLVVWKT